MGPENTRNERLAEFDVSFRCFQLSDWELSTSENIRKFIEWREGRISVIMIGEIVGLFWHLPFILVSLKIVCLLCSYETYSFVPAFQL